jgi:hypothetical protein
MGDSKTGMRRHSGVEMNQRRNAMKAKGCVMGTLFGLVAVLGSGCSAPGDTAALGIMLGVLSNGAVNPRQAQALSTAGQGVQYLSRTQAIANNK